MSSPRTTVSIMTSEVSLVTEDILLSTAEPAVLASTSSIAHQRSSSAAEAAGIDLSAIGKVEARKIMSEEHRVLGFRPPHGSFAAEAQAAAAKHPEGCPGSSPPDNNKLKEVAREDALRILAERNTHAGTSKEGSVHTDRVSGDGKDVGGGSHSPNTGVNLSTISAAEARSLMSHEHRALGYRPPPGSLAAEAQAAAARHPEGNGATLDDDTLREIALRDAERIKADRESNVVSDVNISAIGEEGAATLASATKHALGHTPLTASLAAEAQTAEVTSPEAYNFPADTQQLEEIGKEGEQLKAEVAAVETETEIIEETQNTEETVVVSVVEKSERSSIMVRTEITDSVEIVGDTLG
ncbi:hypothetical protein A0H81_05317 [Grifola frondosa]|uniref:SMP domain-containing protein n=1 Tax=Grifola frondosa TaxID=5627 RepID=A0A1C7MJ07_GRIFR|nr:hypothetical protein A0H81_05317 [Grifola frondosa]